jgi:hypothetical protein
MFTIPSSAALSNASAIADEIDPRHEALAGWLTGIESLEQYEMRHRCCESLKEAIAQPGGDSPLELDVDDLGALELPPAALLRAAGLTAPNLKPTVDFSEPIGLEALEQSLNALEVREIAVSRLAGGRLPTATRLETVQVLDLSTVEGRVNLEPLLRSLAGCPALQEVVLPGLQRPAQAPAGWHYNHKRHLEKTRVTEARLAQTGRPTLGNPQIDDFFRNLRTLLKYSTSLATPIRDAHQQRLKQVLTALTQRPDLHAAAGTLLTQQDGVCIDACLRRLDDIEMLLHCGQLTSTAEAGPAALRVALLRLADQLPAVERRDYAENIEQANALRVLIDQRLNDYLGVSLPVASAPVFVSWAGLPGMAPGATPRPDDWPKEMRQAADRVFQLEVEDDFSSLRLLLAEEEGMGALIAGVLARDPDYQAFAEPREEKYQKAYAAAQDADPGNPTAGSDLNAEKNEELAQRRFELLTPWTDKLKAQVRQHLSNASVDRPEPA